MDVRGTDTRNESGDAPAASGLRALPPAPRAPARVAPLSVLPLFAPLADRPVLVVGGGEGAAWKAELLLAAGARVRVLAGDAALGEGPCAEMRALEARGDGPGTLAIETRGWRPGDLTGEGAPPSPDGARLSPSHDARALLGQDTRPPSGRGTRPFLALIDTGCQAEAAAFAAVARAAGVLVNCIDMPMHCDVRFGSIVNRSPVVVGVSTDGAAPILGQAIRRRIETLLPPRLADWAGLMAEARARVLRLLPDKPARRRFFEGFADLALRGAEPSGGALDALARRAASGGGERGVGHVTLVGAGPGDAELLTLKAVRALQAADVVLFDALVSDEVLELARREARRMLVGKRAARESCRQEDINALMLKLAREGRRVVRLKSGDPMVFGRAGEELDALRAAGIPHDVVPGVTAAFALAAALELSLTHRQLARSVRFVTGHGANGRLPADLDWRGLADPATTLIVYMGARTAPLLAERLRAEGLPPDTPALAATDVARPEQRHWSGTLATLARGLETLDPDRPTILAIGDAVGRAAAGSDAARPEPAVAPERRAAS